MSVIQNIEVSVSEGQICETLRIMFLVFGESSIKGFTLQYSVGVAKLSVERGFLV